MAPRKKTPPVEAVQVSAIALTPAARQMLRRISQEASDRLGWTVSSSAIVRALVSYAGQQSPAWASTTLYPLIEQEIAQGRVWGKKRRVMPAGQKKSPAAGTPHG